MTGIVFSDDDMRRLRAALGVPDDAPDRDAADLLVVLAAEDVAATEAARWQGLGP